MLLLALLLLAALTACGSDPTGALALPDDTQSAVVVRHVDGDTLVLRGTASGPLPEEPTRVRLLQVDTPEVGAEPECGGPESSARLAELLPVGAAVRVAADVDLLDRYGRTLLLVWDGGGRSVQETLVEEGLATVLHVGRNERGLAALEAVEQTARADDRGHWSAC